MTLTSRLAALLVTGLILASCGCGGPPPADESISVGTHRLHISNIPGKAQAWLDGSFAQRDDLADAVKVLVKTYSDTTPYPHKFNDGLVKMHLRNLDFAVRKGIWKERAEHYVWTLGVVVDRHIKKGSEMFVRIVLSTRMDRPTTSPLPSS